MLLPIRPICSKNKVRKDGTSLIFIQSCFTSDSTTLLNTELAIPSKYWNRKLLRVPDDLPKEYGDYKEINKELQRQIRLAEDIISFALDHRFSDPVEFVKKTFRPDFALEDLKKTKKEIKPQQPKVNLDFFFQIEDYINSKKRSRTENQRNMEGKG
jgi:hypothetical protein